jgi:phage terminase large subunit GpA-like protein
VIPFLRACASPLYTEVDLVTGTQMSKTDSICNVMGREITDRPSPLVYFAPTKDFVEQTFEPRFVSMVDSSGTLKTRMSRGKRERLTMKRFGGIKVRFGWAGSPASLAGDPARKVFVDELDLMALDDKRHGDPLERAHARHVTFVDGQTVVTSTPTLGTVEVEQHPETGLYHWKPSDDVQSPIWRRWQEGTRHQWFLRCPDCVTPFFPRLELMVYEESAKPNELTEVFLACPHCGRAIAEAEKAMLFEHAVELAPGQTIGGDGEIVGETPRGRRWSLAVSGLFSPWRSWLTAMQRYREAVLAKDTKRQQAIINTEFGELYTLTGEAPEWKSVASLRHTYRFDEIPAGVRVLTCGVDVQKARLIYAIRGWGVNFESWLIRHGDIWGETEHDFVWGELGRMLSTPITERTIRFTLVDSGYRPGDPWRRPDNQIYGFCRPRVGRVAPSKGHDRQDKPYRSSKIDITVRGRVIKAGLQIWHLDTDYFKTWLYSRFEWPEDQPGGFHLASDTTDEYCMQMTAEAKVAKPSGQTTWVRLRKDNHYLDAEALNVAAAHILQVHLLRHEPPADTPRPAPKHEDEQRRWVGHRNGWMKR